MTWPGRSIVLAGALLALFPTGAVIGGLLGGRWITDSAVARLRAAGLTADSLVCAADPREVLVREAVETGADCLFVGATGASRWERLLAQMTCSKVAAAARQLRSLEKQVQVTRACLRR